MNPARATTAVRLLVIDDTPSIHEDFRKILSAHDDVASLDAAASALFLETPPSPVMAPFTIDSALQGQEGLAAVQAAVAAGRPYAVAFVDMRMPPGWDGIETIRRLWQVDAMLQVVICTAYSDYSWAETIRQLGTSDNLLILKKPFDNIEVQQMAHALARKWELARRVASQMWDLGAEVERRTAELRAAEARFATAFSASPIASSIQFNADHRFLVANPALLALIGLAANDVVGQTPGLLGIWPETGGWLDEVARGQRLRKQPAKLRTGVGELRDVFVSTEPISVEGVPCSLWIIDDVTERLQLEQQLVQAQKMESVGHLAAGIAHDFNNLLTAINIYTAEAMQECAPGTRLHGDLQEVHAAGRRAAALTRQLLIFSRKQFSELAPVRLSEVLDRILPMLRRLIGEDIEFVTDWAANLPLIEGDENNLEHAVLNLVVNARDALPDGGEIRLALRESTISENQVGPHPEARPGRFLVLTVTDNGCGIPTEIQGRIFEPLFTTKGSGKGTGLGLSTVKTIVQQHRGWIELTSVPNEGTLFEIYLPVPAEAAGKRPVAESAAPFAVVERKSGGERILVAEDDDIVRHMLSLLFPRYGYKVKMAHDGPEALAIWRESGGAFDLLITDLVMPKGMSGIDLARELRRLKPELKVILSTGYSAELLRREGSQAIPGATVLLKPYRPEALLKSIRHALQTVGA